MRYTQQGGKQIFATGEQAQAELTRYDAASELFVPFLGGVPAEAVSFSRDGRWVAYFTYPEGGNQQIYALDWEAP